MYVCIKCNAEFPPWGDTTNRQRHNPCATEERRERGGETKEKAEGGEYDRDKCSSLVSEIEIPAAERGGKRASLGGGS